MDPVAAQQALDLAVRHHRSGNLPLAQQLYHQLLVHFPEHPHILHSLGIIAIQTGHLPEAVELIQHAIRRQPDFADAYSNLASVLTDLGQFDEAVAAASHAAALQPGLPAAHNNLGNALRAKGELDGAIAAFRRAIVLQPAMVEAHANLGNVLREKGFVDDAIASFQNALALQPQHAGFHRNLGQAFCDKGDFDRAIAAFRQAIALDPNFTVAYVNLGTAYQALGCIEDALVVFRRVVALNPHDASANCIVGGKLKMQGRHDEAAAAFRQTLDKDPAFIHAHDNLLVTMLYNPACDAHALALEHGRFNDLFAAPLAAEIQPHANERSPDRPLRIGFVSPDFRDHVIGRNLLPLFKHFDHRQFETICYADVPAPDSLTDEFRRLASEFHSTVGVSHAALADQIRRDRIDILVDLALHLSGNRLLTFARKPAPVQVTFAGYPGTTGLQTIDYRLSDPYLDPPDLDPGYSEETFRLPRTFWCFDPLNDAPDVGPLPALSNGHIT